jgi:hypothetical protein
VPVIIEENANEKWLIGDQLDDVLLHETDHKPHPDIQYSGSVRIEMRSTG